MPDRPGLQRDEFMAGMDRLGFKVVGALARIFGALAAKDEETYWFPISSSDGLGFADLAAVIGDLKNATIQITQEADFVATRFLVSTVNPVTGVPIVGSFTASVRDGATDRLLMSSPVHIADLAGNANLSVPFTKNRLFRRNTTIAVSFIQLQAVATRIFFAVQGYKVYDEASLDLVRRR